MSYEKISCRIAIQMCVGYFPDGRERHRTISLRHVCPDVPFETVLELARALAPVLAYPITKIAKVTKIVLFSEKDANVAAPTPASRVDAEPVSEAAPETQRITPFAVFPVTEPPAVHIANGYGAAKSSRFAEGQMGFAMGRAPPARKLIPSDADETA